jgi:hypothetical protein
MLYLYDIVYLSALWEFREFEPLLYKNAIEIFSILVLINIFLLILYYRIQLKRIIPCIVKILKLIDFHEKTVHIVYSEKMIPIWIEDTIAIKDLTERMKFINDLKLKLKDCMQNSLDYLDFELKWLLDRTRNHFKFPNIYPEMFSCDLSWFFAEIIQNQKAIKYLIDFDKNFRFNTSIIFRENSDFMQLSSGYAICFTLDKKPRTPKNSVE